MGTTSRLVAIGTLAAIGLAGEGQAAFANQADSRPIAPSADATRPVVPQSRVRTESRILGMLIGEAFERSATFRALVAAIDATDGLVYLTVGTCGRLRACLLHRVAVAGPNRVLNIVVNAQDDDLRFISPIAHELQHALEILGDARITTDTAIIAFYKSHGIVMKGVIETRAAIAAGDVVRREVRDSIRAARVRSK